MALTHVQPGKTMTYPNSSGATIASGKPVLVGVRLGVASVDIADGESGELMMKEVHSLPKASGAITQGAKLYWDADGSPVVGESASGCLTTTSTDNTLVGVAWAAAGETDATVEIDLNSL